jgi:hypothetical protein
MLRDFGLKASLIVVMALLCAGVSTVNAESVRLLEWTNPTTESLISVFMVSACMHGLEYLKDLRKCLQACNNAIETDSWQN